MSKWIPVTKHMPTTGRNVLLCDNEGGIFIGSYIDYEEEDADPFWVFQHDDEDFCFDEPVAWMPLPEHYVEDETDWFDAEVTDKSKDSITVEVKVNADHVWDVQNVMLDRVLEIIDKVTADHEALPTEIDVGREKAVISFEKKDGMLAMASMIRVLVLELIDKE